jgi:putative acetyltransferase
MSLYPPDANHILDVQALLGRDVSFFVARDHGQAVATGAFRRMPGEAATGEAPYGEIKRMYVDPAQRGKRIAGRVLGAMEDALRAEGCRLALLETGCDQVEAVRLYERCGYTPRAAFGGYADNGLSVFYEKCL